MNITRRVLAVLFSLIITAGLFILMNVLINQDEVEIDDSGARKIADIHMPDREIETNVKQKKPDKVDEPEPPPPDLPQPDLDEPEPESEAISMASPGMSSELDLGFGGLSASDGEFLPMIRIEPTYPRRAQSRGIEGYVVVEFVVTKTGAVRDVVVIEANPANIFNRAAIKAVSKWKYKPRISDGEAMEVTGVQTKLTFELEK